MIDSRQSQNARSAGGVGNERMQRFKRQTKNERHCSNSEEITMNTTVDKLAATTAVQNIIQEVTTMSEESAKVDLIQTNAVIRKVPIGEVQQASPFKELFIRGSSVLAEITESMLKTGVDPAHPIVVRNNTVIDGNTRYEAAIKANMPFIYVLDMDFKSKEDAVAYAVHSQKSRRQFTEADIYHLVLELDKTFIAGRKSTAAGNEPDGQANSGKSADHTAKLVGTYASKIEQIRSINTNGTPEIKAKVISGEWTINKAAKACVALNKASKKPRKKSTKPQYKRIVSVLKKVSKLCGEDEQLEQQIASLIEKVAGMTVAVKEKMEDKVRKVRGRKSTKKQQKKAA